MLGVLTPVKQIIQVMIVLDASVSTAGTVHVLALLVLAVIRSSSHPMLHLPTQQRPADRTRFAWRRHLWPAGRLPTRQQS